MLARSVTIGDSLRGAKRLRRIYDELQATVSAYQGPWGCPTIEGPSLGSTHREFDLGEASGVVKLWLLSHTQEEPQVVAPAQLKLFATGNAQASKDEVQEYVTARFDQEVDGDDAADAAVLAEIAWYLTTKARPRTRVQAEVLHALRNPRPPVRRTNRRERQV